MNDHDGSQKVREETVTPARRRHHPQDAFRTTGSSPPADAGAHSCAGAAERALEPLLTTRELADVWRQTPRWVLRMANKHGLPHYRLGGAIRFRPSEAEAWLQQHRAGGIAGPIPTRGSSLVELRAVTEGRGAA